MGKCSTCNLSVVDGDKFLKCDLCKNHIHIACENIDVKKFNKIISIKDDIIWLCTKCKDKDPLNMLQAIPELIQVQTRLSKELESLKSRIDSQFSTHKQQHSEQVPIIDTIKEMEMRQSKANNLVMVNFESKSEDAKTPVTKFIKENLGVDVEGTLGLVHRTKGEKPLLILKFKTKAARDAVLGASKKLRKSNIDNVRKVFLNPDLTRIQRSRLKVLVTELKDRRAKGEKVVIRGDQIVSLKQNSD